MKQIVILLCILAILVLIQIKLLNRESFTTYNNVEYSNNLTIKDIKALKKGQKIMTKMFKEFDSICRKHKIKYWCIGGTLIGALRHKGWIPWDGDIDIGMIKKDHDKFITVNKELPNDIEFSEPTNKPCSKLRSTKAKYIYTKWGNNWDTNKGVMIDIFVFKQMKSNPNTYFGGGPIKSHKKDVIFPLKEIMFEDIKVYIPNDYNTFLSKNYGSYMELPSKEKKYPHEGRFKF